VAYELPGNFEARKRQILRERHWKKVNNTRNMVALVMILVMVVMTYFVFLK
jgi:heme/copper-type cytochrome/quinol oxidase subunit 2